MNLADELRNYRTDRKHIRWLLSEENRNFW